MPFPVLINTATTATTSGGALASTPLNMPASIVAGRLLVTYAYTVNGVSSMTGWTQIFVVTSTVSFAGFAKVAAGGDTGTVTTAGAAAMGAVVGQYDWWSGTISDIVCATFVGADPPNDNPGASKDWLWVAALGAALSGSGTITAAPASYGDFVVAAAGTTTVVTTGTADRALTASSENPGAFTNGGSPAAPLLSATVAIAPWPLGPAPLVMPSQAAMQASIW